MTLSSQEVDRHLDGLTDFAITTGPLATPVKRKLLRTKYGVHPQRIVSPFTNVAPPGKHLALCCTGELNPGLPVAPGGRGFLLSNRYNDMCTSEFSLFCRVFLNGRAYWRYYGEYRGSHTGFLSPLEFDMQSNKVRLLKSRLLLYYCDSLRLGQGQMGEKNNQTETSRVYGDTGHNPEPEGPKRGPRQ